jgi:hypothetical protein
MGGGECARPMQANLCVAYRNSIMKCEQQHKPKHKNKLKYPAWCIRLEATINGPLKMMCLPKYPAKSTHLIVGWWVLVHGFDPFTILNWLLTFHHVCLSLCPQDPALEIMVGESWMRSEMQQKLGHSWIDLLKNISSLFNAWPKQLARVEESKQILPPPMMQIIMEVRTYM